MKSTPMLIAGVSLLLLMASSGGLAAPPAGEAPPASQPATDARLAALEAEVAALRAELAILATADVRVPEPDPVTSVFLQIPGIPGNSVRDGHEDEIEALAWSWGAHHPAGEGAARSRDVVVLKAIDRASAPLFLACASGAVVPEATLTLRRTIEGESSDYLVLKLTDVRITSVEHGIDGAHELVTLSAAKIQMTYDDAIVAGWDFAANAPT